MSYRELSAWGPLVITLAIFGNYFVSGFRSGEATAGLLLGTVIALIVLEIAYNILLTSQVLFYRMVNGSSWIESAMDWVNALVLVLIASESVRFASQAISYRRGV